MPLLKVRKRNKKYEKRKTWKSNNEYQNRKLWRKNKTSSCITFSPICLGQVEKNIYPSIVVDVDESMCSVCPVFCKSHEYNWLFYCTKTIKDICRCKIENMLAVILKQELRIS